MKPQSNSWSIKDWEIHLSNITRSAVMNMNYDNLVSSTLLFDLKAMLKDWKKEHQEYEEAIHNFKISGDSWPEDILADMAHNGD